MFYGYETVQISREDLHAAAWREPMARLAEQFHVSDVALAKWCRKLNVPVPPRGYWAKVAAGQKPRKAALPRQRKGDQDRAFLPKRSAKPDKPARGSQVGEQADYERAHPIAVPDSVDALHPLVERSRASLLKGRPDETGRCRPSLKGALDLHVSPGQLERASLVMHLLITALDERGFPVVSREGTHLTLPHGTVSIRLEEDTEPIEREPTTAEKRAEAERLRYPRLWFGEGAPPPPKPIKYYSHVPNGRLTLLITDEDRVGVRRRWTEAKRPLEEQLNDVIVGLVRYDDARRLAKEEAARRAREWAEQRQREAEEAAGRRAEQQRRDQLHSDAEAWERYTRALKYVEAVQQRANQMGVLDCGPLTEWLTWARGHLDAIDPMRRFSWRAQGEDEDEDE